jgi:hypothetical protein
MVAYLKQRMGMAGGRAHRYVKNARAASRCPGTFSAWQHRQISGDEAELLFRVAERMPDKYPDAESVLLELVGDGVDETRRILDYWQFEADRSVLDLEDQLDRRHFDVTQGANGMVAGEFALPQLEGETLLAAIDSLMPPQPTTIGAPRPNAGPMLSGIWLEVFSTGPPLRSWGASGLISTSMSI